MSRLVRPPHSVVLVVGREQFTVPGSFAGRTCVATADCLAISVVSVEASATQIGVADGPDPRDGAGGLARLGEFQLETEGLLSIRDVYSREYENVGVTPGLDHGDRLGRRGRGAEPDRAAGRGGPAGGRVPLAAAQESKPSPARSRRPQPEVAAAAARVGLRQRPAGQLDAGVAQRLGRERHRPLAHHASAGSARCPRPPAGPARRRRRTGSPRRRARCSRARRPTRPPYAVPKNAVNRVQVSITPGPPVREPQSLELGERREEVLGEPARASGPAPALRSIRLPKW